MSASGGESCRAEREHVKIGVGLMQNPTDVSTILKRARLADTLGFHSMWLADHLLWPRPVDPPGSAVETWTMMTAAACVTEGPELGFIMLNSSLRPPALLAKMASTLDQISRGRLIFSLGTGYFEREFSSYGLPFIADKDGRVAYQREVALLSKQLWTHPSPEVVDFDGEHVQVSGCQFSPPPYRQPHPPIWFGGDSASTRSLVAEVGDGWIMHSHAIASNLDAFRREHPGFDRDLTIATMINTSIAATREDAVRQAQSFTLNSKETFDSMVEHSLIGTVDWCVQRLSEIAALGVDHVILAIDGEDTMQVLADEVLPRFASV
jgi:alkanesulfonate monooxygenase SsuD/methylene tetrahydromethanopterin reductase-like flavin-dependent oxidoreductase (luciferase family)